MRWDRPAAGREPAAAALLGWLADPHAPRLCLVSGSTGCGKSTLLAWLVQHGSRHGAATERAVHAVVPFAEDSLRGTVWSLADQLGVVARAPGELVAALGNDPRRTVIVLPGLPGEDIAELALALVRLPHLRLIVECRSHSPVHRLLAATGCAELDLDRAWSTDRARYEQWRAARPDSSDAITSSADVAVVDLSDPRAVCEADPWTVTVAYEQEREHGHGGLRDAWLRAGQALGGESSPASRALLLLTALGDHADPRLAPVLSDLASQAPWRMEWSRVRGDLTPPWPGPVTGLALGRGPLSGSLIVAGHDGTARTVHVADATARGRWPWEQGRPAAMSVMEDGTVLLLDRNGRVHADTTWAARPAKSAIETVLDARPTGGSRLVTMLRGQTGTSLAWGTAERGTDIVAIGDAQGTVRVFGDVHGKADLHHGQVTALTAFRLQLDHDAALPLLYSGGADGTVRAWAPGHAPQSTPVVQRSRSVVSLDAADTARGPELAVAWDDGVVSLHGLDDGTLHTFRSGSPVRAVTLIGDERVLIGTDEALICLTPQHGTPRGDSATS
ncbi:hypothetical protein [Streptomyces sp. NPDC020965]|uniref:hypothetical protein n=1 Tax=Streptomyces sp. NPDC020965 TaxID=3365105 RepID=UPI0037A5F160